MSDGKLGEAGKELVTPTTEMESQPSCVLCHHSGWLNEKGRCRKLVAVEPDQFYSESICGCKCAFPPVELPPAWVAEECAVAEANLDRMLGVESPITEPDYGSPARENEQSKADAADIERPQEPPERIWIQGDGNPVDPYQNVALEVKEPYRPDQWIEYRRVLPDTTETK